MERTHTPAVIAAESRKRKREEYEMQLFGFHTRAVYATLKNMITNKIQSKSRKLREALEKVNKTDTEILDTLRTSEDQLVRAYHAASLSDLKTIENVVNKFMRVPNNILAEEDKLQTTQYTETEFEGTSRKLDELQQRAKRATVLNAALKEELQLMQQFSVCVDNVDKLNQIVDNSVTCPDADDKIHRLVEDYKRFGASLDDRTVVSQKTLYNTVDDLECTDCDVDSL